MPNLHAPRAKLFCEWLLPWRSMNSAPSIEVITYRSVALLR